MQEALRQGEKTPAPTAVISADLLRPDFTAIDRVKVEAVEPNKAALKLLGLRRRTVWPRK